MILADMTAGESNLEPLVMGLIYFYIWIQRIWFVLVMADEKIGKFIHDTRIFILVVVVLMVWRKLLILGYQ